MNFYMIYLNRDDELIASGTAGQCARKLGIKLGSFYSLVSRAPRRENGKYAVVKQSMGESTQGEEEK